MEQYLEFFLICGHCWPIVPAPDDMWGWLWRNWWNKDWQGKPKYSEKTCPGTTLSTTNPTWLYPGLNPGRRSGKPATNRLTYGVAIFWIYYESWRSGKLSWTFINKSYIPKTKSNTCFTVLPPQEAYGSQNLLGQYTHHLRNSIWHHLTSCSIKERHKAYHVISLINN
jgi:hypothetical protein